MHKTILFYPVLLLVCLSSCKKQLDTKADKKLVTIRNLTDAQALLDNTGIMYSEPVADESSSDNYYLTDATFNALPLSQSRALYSWEKGYLFDGTGSDWGVAYRKVYYCNTVLDALENITSAEAVQYKDVKGQALFKRAKSFWHIVNIWAPAYDAATASTSYGIPLRLHADFNEVSIRASVQESFDRILSDLKASVPLLPVVPLHAVRPSRTAAYAMLSRVYLSLHEFTTAGKYADSALSLSPGLIDYNSVSNVPAFPFASPNAETLYTTISGGSIITPSRAIIDSTLYKSYHVNDLRKILFFKSLGNNQYSFRGSYTGSDNQFAGISTSEVYLTRAECRAREGNTAAALADLNFLLGKRFRMGTFSPETAANPAEALAIILTERRKELLMRFTRWMDIKRLNAAGAGIVLKRFINGQYYTLIPNDLRYALPLPEDVLAISGMPQNPR